jgi:AcrR family transcriptional regulator
MPNTAKAPKPVSPSRARRDREKAETRQLILAAARELFTTEGYAETSMRKIADKIGYTATAIYHHFKDKDALLNELCVNDFRQMGEALRQAGKIPDPVQRIRLMGVNYVRFALANPQQFRFMFMIERPIPGPDDVTIDPSEDGYQFLVDAVEEGLRLGLFRPEFTNPHLLAQLMWAGVHGVATIHMMNHHKHNPWIEHVDAVETAEAMVDVVCRGVLK